MARWLRRRGGVGNLVSREPALLADVAALHHWGVVRALVDGGFPTTNPSETGATALHYAAAAGEPDIVDFLIEHGADPAAVDGSFGFDAAGWASHFGHADLAARIAQTAG